MNSNIRDLLQKSFVKYANTSDNTIVNPKRSLEDGSSVDEPSKKKLRQDAPDRENSQNETGLGVSLVKKKKKRKDKKAEKTEKPHQHNVKEYLQKNGPSPVETELGDSEVLIVPKKKKKHLDTPDGDQSQNETGLEDSFVKEKKKRKRKKSEKQKKKQQQHIVEEDHQENGHFPVESELGNGEVLVVPKELMQSSQVKKKKVAENLDAFTHFEFSQNDPKDADAVSGKVSYEVQGPGGSSGNRKYKPRGKSVSVKPTSCEYVFDTENEDEEDSVEEEPAMVRIKIEPEDPGLMQMLEKTKNKNKSKTTKRKRSANSSILPKVSKIDYFNSDVEYNVNMAVEDSMKNLDNFSGQILAAVKWILSQNIRVSPLNMTYQRHHIFERRNAGTIVEMTGTPLRFFTEAEDDEVLQRIQFLEQEGVITSARGLCNELNQVELSRKKDCPDKNKHALRIIGLYLCQNLTNRLAFYTTERLLKLMDKLTATPKKAKEVTGRRPWTLDDDKIIVKSVLFNIISQSYVRVETVNDKLTNWDDIVTMFPEGQRSRSQVKERWMRVLKVRLLEAEMDPEETWTYRRQLLEYIIRLGVTDRREIRWKEVALEFPSKTSAALNQDFWGLIRRSLSPDTDFQVSLELAYQKLDRQQTKNIQRCKIIKKEEDKSELMDWYRTLKFLS